MRSKIIFPLMFGLVLAVAMASVAFSQDPPSDVEFNRPENALKTKFPPVAFDHGTHEAVADSCTDCHHTWDEESEIKPCSASGCHDNMTDRHLATSYFRAFHDKHSNRSCLGCHLELNREAKAEGEDQMQLAPCSNNMCHASAE